MNGNERTVKDKAISVKLVKSMLTVSMLQNTVPALGDNMASGHVRATAIGPSGLFGRTLWSLIVVAGTSSKRR